LQTRLFEDENTSIPICRLRHSAIYKLKSLDCYVLVTFNSVKENGIIQMNPKIITALKVALVAVIGMCIVILLSVNKISSSIVLTITAIVVLLPIGKSTWLKWGRVAFVLIAFALVLLNISTTDYPMGYYNTGFKFFDQVLHIFDGFLKNVFNTRLNP
jgi:hypothetical protein